MIKIREAQSNDQETVISLIQKYMGNLGISKDIWERLFINHWNFNDNYFGNVMVENGEVFGFLGTIISERRIKNKLEKFCNITTFVVDEKYRKNSVALLHPLLKAKDLTITALTSSESSNMIYNMAGFKILESRMKIIFPNLINSLKVKNFDVILDNKIVENTISDDELKIYNDHLKFDATFILIKSSNSTCFIVGKKSKKKKIPLLHIHYIGNKSLFRSFINYINLTVCSHLKVIGFLVEERYLTGLKINNFFLSYKLPQPTTYKSSILDNSSIDTLYSEFFLLNL